jgi:hypothetical protein
MLKLQFLTLIFQLNEILFIYMVYYNLKGYNK